MHALLLCHYHRTRPIVSIAEHSGIGALRRVAQLLPISPPDARLYAGAAVAIEDVYTDLQQITDCLARLRSYYLHRRLRVLPSRMINRFNMFAVYVDDAVAFGTAVKIAAWTPSTLPPVATDRTRGEKLGLVPPYALILMKM